MELHLDQMIYYSPKCIFLYVCIILYVLTDQPFYILSSFLGFYSTFQDFLAPVISWESHSTKPWIAKCYVLISSAHHGCKRKASSKWFWVKGVNTLQPALGKQNDIAL